MNASSPIPDNSHDIRAKAEEAITKLDKAIASLVAGVIRPIRKSLKNGPLCTAYACARVAVIALLCVENGMLDVEARVMERVKELYVNPCAEYGDFCQYIEDLDLRSSGLRNSLAVSIWNTNSLEYPSLTSQQDSVFKGIETVIRKFDVIFDALEDTPAGRACAQGLYVLWKVSILLLSRAPLIMSLPIVYCIHYRRFSSSSCGRTCSTGRRIWRTNCCENSASVSLPTKHAGPVLWSASRCCGRIL